MSLIPSIAALLAVTPAIYYACSTLGKRYGLQAQYPSSHFVLSAGALPFQFDSTGYPRRIVLVHYAARDEWLLAKGRKDEGEDLATAATREVREETGYSCRLHPVPRLPTCAPVSAPAAAGFQPQAARIARDSTEPFEITIRPLGRGRVKVIFWFIGTIDVPFEQDAAAEAHAPGSHQVMEGFDNVQLFDIDEAMEKLAYEGDRELVRTAVSILTAGPAA